MPAALLAIAYLCYTYAVHPELHGTGNDGLWHLIAGSLATLLSALLMGQIRDRFDLLLDTERTSRIEAGNAAIQTKQILDNIADGFVAMDHEWRFTYVNRAAERLMNRRAETLIGKDARTEFPQTDSMFYDQYLEAFRTGRPVEFEAPSLLVDAWFKVHAYPAEQGLLVYFRDISEQKKTEDRLRGMSMVDDLTGLYNRRGFFALAEQHFKLAERNDRSLLLIFADLDSLKEINDSHGHRCGDQALYEIAGILSHSFRDSDTIARIGGDEFAALAAETAEGAAEQLVERIRERVGERNERGDLPYELSLSIGVASFSPENPCTIDEMLAEADRRMYAEKRIRHGNPPDSTGL
ncbi:MAG TPA: diguanylate cyclase [Longimicrobiaceae bacterium]|nr:diguanylate cyclase [Longimicrobiaceae bacterium]